MHCASNDRLPTVTLAGTAVMGRQLEGQLQCLVLLLSPGQEGARGHIAPETQEA
jgi:hypothetical protein